MRPLSLGCALGKQNNWSTFKVEQIIARQSAGLLGCITGCGDVNYKSMTTSAPQPGCLRPFVGCPDPAKATRVSFFVPSSRTGFAARLIVGFLIIAAIPALSAAPTASKIEYNRDVRPIL